MKNKRNPVKLAEESMPMINSWNYFNFKKQESVQDKDAALQSKLKSTWKQ